MTMIATQRNKVFTEAPEPDDVMVEVILFGEGDTPGTVCGRKLRHLPITHYQECLDWAVAIADQMARPAATCYPPPRVSAVIAPFRRAPSSGCSGGAQINIKKTENYSYKRLIDMTNAEINKLTPDR